MDHTTPLVATVVAGLGLAFIFGTLALRLKISPLIGYLLAGVVVGPFTPGYVADQNLANELAELGVILLMFGVGLHFSWRELMAVRKVAVPGALVQIAVAVGLGMGLALLMGWSIGAGFVFGLALSVASTVVLLRALQQQRILDTDRGHIAVGWLIVEDIVMVLALVLLPVLASGGTARQVGQELAFTMAMVGVFAVLMLVVGRRVIPGILHEVAHTGSRELFRLAVLAIALGVAFGAAKLFGVSFALGAFFAGMVLAESPLSQRAAEETLPLRDAFAVLFFVSVGMLFNPAILATHPLPLLATLAIIIFGKSLAAYLIVRSFGRSPKTALTIAASLAQIGEFSFILVGLGAGLNLISAEARDLVLAGAILSIMINPLLFRLIDLRLIDRLAVRIGPGFGRNGLSDAAEAEHARQKDRDRGHVVLVGCGRVGHIIGETLTHANERLIIIDLQHDATGVAALHPERFITGNAAAPETLAQCDLAAARLLLVAVPDGFEAGQIVEQAREINPGIKIVARAHSDAEVTHLEKSGANLVIMGEREIAARMIDHAFATR